MQRILHTVFYFIYNIENAPNLLHKSHLIPHFKYLSSRFADVFVQSIEGRCWVDSEDVVGAATTGDTPIASE